MALITLWNGLSKSFLLQTLKTRTKESMYSQRVICSVYISVAAGKLKQMRVGKSQRNLQHSRGVVPGGAMAPPDFGRSVNPISTRGDRLCPSNYYWHPRIFRPSNGPEDASEGSVWKHQINTIFNQKLKMEYEAHYIMPC